MPACCLAALARPARGEAFRSEGTQDLQTTHAMVISIILCLRIKTIIAHLQTTHAMVLLQDRLMFMKTAY